LRRVAPSAQLSPDYHRGVPGAEPYPLWIEPDRRLRFEDVVALMRDHYEGTPWDMTQGVDAGPFGSPNRWRPMTWTVDGADYSWERPISTQQTGYSFISQSRAWLPDAVGGVLWYGVDDTYTTCYVPLYCGIEAVPTAYAAGTLRRFSWDSAWWVFNFVANLANLKYSAMIADIQVVQQELESRATWLQPAFEKVACEVAQADPQLLASFLTDYSLWRAGDVVDRWRQLGEDLLTRYNDGYVQDEDGHPQEVGYQESWLRDVLRLRPEAFRMHGAPGDSLPTELPY
jgi:dipeptidase